MSLQGLLRRKRVSKLQASSEPGKDVQSSICGSIIDLEQCEINATQQEHAADGAARHR